MGLPDPEDLGGAIDSLLGSLLSSLPDDNRRRVEELVQLLTELYGAGLARTLEMADDPALRVILGRDPLVAPLLALHGLHPDPLEARALAGVQAAGPALAPAGARAHLDRVDVATSTVVVTVRGHGGPGSAARWEALVRRAVGETAPEATVEISVHEPPPPPSPAAPPGAAGSPVTVELRPTRAPAPTS